MKLTGQLVKHEVLFQDPVLPFQTMTYGVATGDGKYYGTIELSTQNEDEPPKEIEIEIKPK